MTRPRVFVPALLACLSVPATPTPAWAQANTAPPGEQDAPKTGAEAPAAPAEGQGEGEAKPDAAPAEGEGEGEGEAKPDAAPEGGDATDGDGVPALPPPVEGEAPADDAAPAPEEPPPGPVTVTPEELARLKAQIKEELASELRSQMQSDLEAAARDAATQRAAAVEWEEERWVEEVKPKLNFLEFNGYFRTRFDYFNRLDLGTYDPILQRGTSSVKPPTLYRPFDGEPGCEENGTPDDPALAGQICADPIEDTSSLYGFNMRLRLEPTLNISEDIRIKSTVDVLDNLVLGSTPESKPGFLNNPTLPLPLFASSQLPVQEGLNSVWEAIRLKRLYAEVMTPFGLLRFGRQPQNWGLGLLVNDGNGIDQDYGDSADQILFATRIAGHYIIPAYSISSSGPSGRGGGAGVGGDNGLQAFPNEGGQRYNLDPRDDVHTFILTVVKKDKPEDIKAQLASSDWPVVNYGVFGVYRRQEYDIPDWYNFNDPTLPPSIDQYVKRNANAGVASAWFLFMWQKFKFEMEAVGIVGHIANTATLGSEGIDSVN